MGEIPYPKVTLRPYSLGGENILSLLSEGVFPSYLKEKFKEYVSDCCQAKDLKYSTEPKEFYIIPYGKMKEALEEFNLRPPKFAALWLPAIALKVCEIRAQYPEGENEISIVAYDYYSPDFSGGFVLAVDISLGIPAFVLWQNDTTMFFHNHNYCVLVELSDSE